jgi:predicted transcriptional regulator
MRVEKRSWPSIIVDILQVTLTASNKTRVMYRSNLNFERFNRYFHALLRKGFIEEQNGSNGRLVYKTTEHGRTLLEVLQMAQDLVLAKES